MGVRVVLGGVLSQHGCGLGALKDPDHPPHSAWTGVGQRQPEWGLCGDFPGKQLGLAPTSPFSSLEPGLVAAAGRKYMCSQGLPDLSVGTAIVPALGNTVGKDASQLLRAGGHR